MNIFLNKIKKTILILFIFNPKIFAKDIILDVPFVQYEGNRWTISCITMAIKYFKNDVTLEDVLKNCGYPLMLNYYAIDKWFLENYKLRLIRFDRKTINYIIESIKNGYPVVLMQKIFLTEDIDTTRTIVGFNLEKKEFVLREPNLTQSRMYVF